MESYLPGRPGVVTHKEPMIQKFYVCAPNPGSVTQHSGPPSIRDVQEAVSTGGIHSDSCIPTSMSTSEGLGQSISLH